MFLKTAAGADPVTIDDCATLAHRTATGTEILWQARRLGEVWYSAPPCPDFPWKDICWSPVKKLFVAVGTLGGIMTSPDGLVWTQRTYPARNSWQAVCYGNGKFVAIAYSGTQRAMTSPDGINWTAHTIPSGSWSDITYGNGRYVAVGQSGTFRIAYSSDGINWTETNHLERFWKGVAFAKGIFVAVSKNGEVATSVNGQSWSMKEISAGTAFNHVFTDGERFVAVASTGSTRLMTSEDGLTWTPRAVPALALSRGDGMPGVMVVVGFDGILTSYDNGLTWQSRSAPVDLRWQSVVCSPNRLVAITQDLGLQVAVSD